MTRLRLLCAEYSMRELVVVSCLTAIGASCLLLGLVGGLGLVRMPWPDELGWVVVVTGALHVVAAALLLSEHDWPHRVLYALYLNIAPLHVLARSAEPLAPVLVGYFLYVLGGAMTLRITGALPAIVLSMLSLLGIVVEGRLQPAFGLIVALGLGLSAGAVAVLLETFRQNMHQRDLLLRLRDIDPDDVKEPLWREGMLATIADGINAEYIALQVLDHEGQHLSQVLAVHNAYPFRVEPAVLERRQPVLSEFVRSVRAQLRTLGEVGHAGLEPDRFASREPDLLPTELQPPGFRLRDVFSVPVLSSGGDSITVDAVLTCANKRIQLSRRGPGELSRLSSYLPRPRSVLSFRTFSRGDARFVARAIHQVDEDRRHRQLLDLARLLDLVGSAGVESREVGDVLQRVRDILGSGAISLVELRSREVEVVVRLPPDRGHERTASLEKEPLLGKVRSMRTVQRSRGNPALRSRLLMPREDDLVAAPIASGEVVTHILYVGGRAAEELPDSFFRSVASSLGLILAHGHMARLEALSTTFQAGTPDPIVERVLPWFREQTAEALSQLLRYRRWIVWVAEPAARRLVAVQTDPKATFPTEFTPWSLYKDAWLAKLLRGKAYELAQLDDGRTSQLANANVFRKEDCRHFVGVPILSWESRPDGAGLYPEQALMGAISIYSHDKVDAREYDRLELMASRLAVALTNLTARTAWSAGKAALQGVIDAADPSELSTRLESFLAQQFPASEVACLERRRSDGRFVPGSRSAPWFPELSEEELGTMADSGGQWSEPDEMPVGSPWAAALRRRLGKPAHSLLVVPIRASAPAVPTTLGLIVLAHRQRRGGQLPVDWYSPLETTAVRSVAEVVAPLAQRLQDHVTHRDTLIRWAHESKGPVRRAREWVSWVKGGICPVDDPVDPLRRATDNCDRALWLVDVIERAQRRLRKEDEDEARTVDIGRYLGRFMEDMEPIARLASVELRYNMPTCSMSVRVREDSLYMAISNLINNAIKYSGEGGGVDVSAKQENGRVVVSVADSGPGLSDSEVRAVMRPYVQGGKQGKVYDGFGLGMGLGLAITVQALADCQSTLRVDRSASGSTFSFELPLKSAHEVTT